MKEDLHLTGLRYNIVAALFYVRICLVYKAEVPYHGHRPPDTILPSGSTLVGVSLPRHLTFASETLFVEISYSGCLPHLGGVRFYFGFLDPSQCF
jgi:hypothetical protein